VVREVTNRLGDQLCFAFRHFPLASLHPHAQHAAEAAEAADAQGAFWAMHDMLFEHQRALEDDDLASYASTLAIDARRLADEVLAGIYATRVRDDFRSGVRGGVNGTPTFFVNGQRHAGPPTVDALLSALTHRRSR
jgi:protein-disulfide isomerase